MQNSDVLIVIPTTGSVYLEDALASIETQTYQNIKCLVVVDGPQHEAAANKILQKFPQFYKMVLPWNVGADGWYGHRIYYMSAAILQEAYWIALDQDNWYDSDHVESLIDGCQSNNWQWAHSLRKIYDRHKNFLCNDNCESLGKYPIYLNDSAHLVDTSTYCIRKDIIVNLAPAWYSGWGGDRRFYAALSRYAPNYGCTKKHSVCYRLDGNPNSVNADFFVQGNKVMAKRYPMGLPWLL